MPRKCKKPEMTKLFKLGKIEKITKKIDFSKYKVTATLKTVDSAITKKKSTVCQVSNRPFKCPAFLLNGLEGNNMILVHHEEDYPWYNQQQLQK